MESGSSVRKVANRVRISVQLLNASTGSCIWAERYDRKDNERCKTAGVPEQIGFATNNPIALEQLGQCCERGLPPGIVLADAAYGNDHKFREGVEALDLSYVVGIKGNTGVWTPGVRPAKYKTTVRKGCERKYIQYTEGHKPQSVKKSALALNKSVWRTIQWREGTNDTLEGRFAAVRVSVAHRDHLRSTLREEQWLLIEWPEGDKEPAKYWLSNLPTSTTLKHLVYTAKMRWHIERDYQELKDELGLNHYEGRNWRGFHHHAILCIAAYAYLVAQRISGLNKGKKTPQNAKTYRTKRLYRPGFSRGHSDMLGIQLQAYDGKLPKPLP